MIPLDRVRAMLAAPYVPCCDDRECAERQAERDVHDLAAQVIALAEALTTAERDLAASRQAHAELAALVRAYLAASDRYEAAWAPMLVHDGPPLSDEAVAAAVAGPDAEMGAARTALDAALAATTTTPKESR